LKYSISVIGCLAILALATSAASAKPYEVVYTMSNDVNDNQVLLFREKLDGSLKLRKAISTGGRGSTALLGGINQGAIALDRSRRWLLVVNAGSNEISVFEASRDDLRLVSRISSGGTTPVSVAVDRDLVYVVNSGSSNVVGFRLNYNNGQLTPIPDSAQPLSAQETEAGQVGFSSDGRSLVVTEHKTSRIDTFAVNRETGLLNPAVVNQSVGNGPIGFAFDPWGRLIVSETNSNDPNRGSASSYNLEQTGLLNILSPSVANQQTASCWVVITKNGKFAYISNPLSNSLSGYQIGNNGQLQLLTPNGVTATTGDFPLDVALSHRGWDEDLYVFNAGNHTISSFEVNDDGSLAPKPGAAPVPTGANGLLVR
jgi:6-phosphogluconolactonase